MNAEKYVIININVIKNGENKKENLTKSDVKLISNTWNGNCFFKSISQFINNCENYHI